MSGAPHAPGAHGAILIVEDEPALADGLRFNLEHEGYAARVVASAEAAAPLLAEADAGVDLVLLDVMLPGASGFDLLERLRDAGRTVPVILLTARGDDLDVIRGLELGADDYVTKPFSLGQLIARVRAVLRRVEGGRAGGPEAGGGRVVAGEVTIDLTEGVADGAPGGRVELTATETEILRVIAAAPGRVASRDAILDRIWGRGRYPSTRTVDNHIARIRKKLERDPSDPTILVTVHGKGYRLAVR